MTPTEDAFSEASATALDNSGRRAYEASGLTAGDDYMVALLDADAVTVTDGTVTLDDYTLSPAVTVSIELVNGASTAAAAGSGNESKEEEAEAQADGTITFSIDSNEAADVIPVVYADADSDGALDLNADGTPSEDFGIGGQQSWIPAEAGDGVINGTVTSTSPDNDFFTLDDGTDETYFYDDDDVYRLNGTTITMAQFEGLLTGDDVAGDTVAGTSNYESDAAESSIFDVTADNVPLADEVEAEITAEVEDDNTVLVTWEPSDQGDVTYTVTRDDGIGGAQVELDSGITGTSYTDEGVADLDPGDAGYIYEVTATGGTSNTDSATRSSDALLVPAADIELNVLANGAVVDSDADADGEATSGDVWVLYFDEDAVIADGATMQVSDGANEAIIEEGVNATVVANGSVVTITLTDDLVDGAAALEYEDVADALTIDASAGIESVDGVEADFTDDSTLEDDGPEIYADTAATDDTTFTITFNEELLEASAENEANYSYDADGAGIVEVAEVPTSATLGADGRTVTLTVTTPVAAGATVDPTGVVDTDGQASAQGAYDAN